MWRRPQTGDFLPLCSCRPSPSCPSSGPPPQKPGLQTSPPAPPPLLQAFWPCPHLAPCTCGPPHGSRSPPQHLSLHRLQGARASSHHPCPFTEVETGPEDGVAGRRPPDPATRTPCPEAPDEGSRLHPSPPQWPQAHPSWSSLTRVPAWLPLLSLPLCPSLASPPVSSSPLGLVFLIEFLMN